VSLRNRLALIVAAVVTLVVGLGSYVQIRLFEHRAASGMRVAAAEAAQSTAAELASASTALSAAELHDRLEARVQEASISSLAVVEILPTGEERMSTSAVAVSEAEADLARAALQGQQPVWRDAGPSTARVAVPTTRQEGARAAVVVTVSFETLRRLVRREVQFSLVFVAGAALIVALLVNLLARPFLHAPIEAILDTMARAGGGDLAVRAAVQTGDEVGRVAAGLNQMLDRTHSLNASLQERVDEATRELRKSNDDLVSSYQRMFSLREALARAEQTAAAGQTAANLAHQIGTPLNLISGYVQMMFEDAADARQAERLRSVQEQIKRVTGYIRATLDHVRRPPLSKDPVFPAAMLRRLSEVSRPRLNAAGIDLQLDVDDQLPWLMGDLVQLELALLNLINNGLEAMPDGGTLSIRARASDTTTTIEVADTGTGIPADLVPRIFEPWVTTKPLGRGTGLGLSITREVITAHGGTIRVESPPGRGAHFIVELPGKPGTPAIREV
jgi:signal transduction histidine kinase